MATSDTNEVVIGIDLGTTYSCAAFVQNGQPKIIPSERGYTTVPSVVGLNKKGEVVVGHVALDQMVTDPTATIYGSKRLVGRKFHSPIVQEMMQFMSYPIVEGSSGEAAVRLGNKTYDLSEISAMILSELRDVAQAQLDRKITHAVITVPAYYGDLQRQAVKKAGAIAGLTVDRIVNEPTAAAIAYGFNKDFKQKILVYDLGGGTFDVSILQVQKNEFRVLATGGDTFLGGVDVDNRLVAYAIDKFREATTKDLGTEKMAIQRIRSAAERAKRELSTQTSVEISLPYITLVDGKPVDLKVKLTRDLLDRLTKDLIDRTLKICDEVLNSARMKKSEIQEILLVGGQTRMPVVQQRILEHFGKPARKGVHPDEVVALGAAILANPESASTQVQLHDVLSIPIGIALAGGKFKIILDQNIPIPASKAYRVAITRNDMLVIDIYQGSHLSILKNEYLGTFTFPAPSEGKKEGRNLEMRFDLSAECLLKVRVKDIETGEETLSEMITLQTPVSLKESLVSATAEDRGWIKKWVAKLFRY